MRWTLTGSPESKPYIQHTAEGKVGILMGRLYLSFTFEEAESLAFQLTTYLQEMHMIAGICIDCETLIFEELEDAPIYAGRPSGTCSRCSQKETP